MNHGGHSDPDSLNTPSTQPHTQKGQPHRILKNRHQLKRQRHQSSQNKIQNISTVYKNTPRHTQLIDRQISSMTLQSI